MKKTGKIYLVCGKTGSGKTTISKKIEEEFGAYRISHDELLIISYDRETRQRQFKDCCERMNQLAYEEIKRLSRIGIDIVLEGWGTRVLRDEVRTKCEDLGIKCEVIVVECPREVRLQRVMERNKRTNEEVEYIDIEDFQRMEELEGVDLEQDEVFRTFDNSKHNKAMEVTLKSWRF